MSKVRYELRESVAVITLYDPGTMNAAGLDMIEDLSAAFDRAEKEARGALLTGEGKGFCSGANLSPSSGPLGGGGAGFDAGAALDTHYNPFILKLKGLSIPFVTAVNGAAAGVGCSMALMGDLIVAGESAYFLQAFRRIGLVPDGGSTWLLPRKIGRARAMEMMLLGDKISARQALDWGLVNRCVSDDRLQEEALILAKRLADGPKAISMIREIAWSAFDHDLPAQLTVERMKQRDAGRTEDFVEGVTAFLQKREAHFKGS